MRREILFLTPLLSEKYMSAAKFALDVAAKEFKSRARSWWRDPATGVTPEQAAREILSAFLPRAFRRPVAEDGHRGVHDSVPRRVQAGAGIRAGDCSSRSAACWCRPDFLSCRAANPHRRPPRGPYSLASRMSYFLWGSMPDELAVRSRRSRETARPRGGAARSFRACCATNRRWCSSSASWTSGCAFAQLDTDKAPDPKLFPAWATDERSALRHPPPARRCSSTRS